MSLVVRNRLRKTRLVYKLTQSQLASAVGVSKNAISSYERGEYLPSLFVALQLCTLFACDIEWLFYLEGGQQ